MMVRQMLTRILFVVGLWLLGCVAALAQNADIQVNGSITSTQIVQFNVNGQGTIGASVQGTYTGTVVFEGSVDGINFVSTPAITLNTGVPVTSLTVTTGAFQINTAGLSVVRVRGNTVATGTATVALRGSSGAVNQLAGPLPGSGNAGYPPGATPVTANASGTTAAVAATLPASASGKITFLCGIYVTGTTSTTANSTAVTAVSGATTLLSTLVAHLVTPALGTLAPPSFAPDCLTAGVANQSIVVTSAADAAGSNVTVNAWGYQQ